MLFIILRKSRLLSLFIFMVSINLELRQVYNWLTITNVLASSNQGKRNDPNKGSPYNPSVFASPRVKFRSCGCEISPKWQRNFVRLNGNSRARQRNFVANFRRIFLRTKDEIQRISLSFLLHRTVNKKNQRTKTNKQLRCRAWWI